MRDRCDYCGSRGVEPVNDAGPPCLRGDFRIVDGTIQNVICLVCGTAWNRSMMDARGLHELYAGYTKKTDDACEDDLLFDPLGPVVTLGRNQVAFLERHLPRSAPGRLLDVGCGKGTLLASFGESFPGWTRQGIEPSSAAAAIARGLQGVTVHEGMLDTVPIAPSSFDLVTLVHVLEHASSASAALRTIHQALRPGGLLFVEVPNMIDRNMFYDWLLHEHVFHFSPDTLRRLLTHHGFGVEAIEPSTSYGAIRVIGRKVGEEHATADVMDAILPRVRSGVSEWRRLWGDMQTRADRLADIAHGGKRVALFGAGMTSAVVLAYTALNGAPLVALLDENPWKIGRTYFGRPIVGLTDAAGLGLDVVGIATIPGSHLFVRRKLSAAVAPGTDIVPLADGATS